MKYEISENIKAAIPEEVRNSKTSNILTWFLYQLMKSKVNYPLMFRMLLWVAEVSLTLPVSNA